MKLHAVLFLFLTNPVIGLAARILAYFPIPAPSHHFFFQPILRGLAERGHQIDYYSPIPLKVPHDNITYIHMDNFFDVVTKEMDLVHQSNLPVLQQLSDMMSAGATIEPLVCKLPVVQNLLNSNTTYDLLIHESMYVLETGVVFKHKFNVPSVGLSAVSDFFQMNEFSGLLINPSYMVGIVSELSDHMNFFERLYNTYVLLGSMFLEYGHLRDMQRIADDCFIYPGWESRPRLSRLIADQSLILVNDHPSIGFPFPKPPHVKDIGGAVILPKKPLEKDLEDFITGAKDGVIYFSLGTLFDWNAANADLKDVFSKVFSSRKERILWKLPIERWESLPSHVKISKWFPQQDILAHKNVKLFITHGGLQSTFETVHYAVPVIVIPAFADQVKNSLGIAQHGYGVRLMLNNITESSLSWALDEVLGQPKYKRQVVKGSALLNDRMINPVDEGVFWIEYVLRHGNVLQPVGARLEFIQRHCLDILAFVLTVILALMFLTKVMLTFFHKKITLSHDIRGKKKQE